MPYKNSQKIPSTRNSRIKLTSIIFVLALASCNTVQPGNSQKAVSAEVQAIQKSFEFNPLRDPKLQPDLPPFVPEAVNSKTQFRSGPGVNITSTVADAQVKELTLNLTGQPLSANYHDMPLPIFINEVFGNQLGLSFSLDPQIQKQSDLVSLRVNDPVSPSELFRIAARTLSAYGVAVSQQDNVLSFSIDKNISSGETPLLVSGRTLPDVPESHRPVFMFVQLKTVSNNKVASWVTSALTGKDIKVAEDATRNAVMLSGKPDVVRQALAIIEVLDQPLMRGKYSASIEPAFTKVAELSRNLKEVLTAEGYDANIKSTLGSIIIVPLEGTNQLVVFAASQAVLDHVREWVTTLDRRQQMSIDQGIFTYEVRNTEAGHIVELLNGIESGASTTTSSFPRTGGQNSNGSAVSDTANASNSANVPVMATGKISGGNFAVDTNRNTIIFKGSGQAWADLLPVIQTLDKAAPSVLIEVLIAEVTLNDTENTGFEFLAKGIVTNNGRPYPTFYGTLGGLGVGAVEEGATAALGFTAEALNSAGNTRAILNLFQQNKRAEIRSRPRLMVKSGQQATIDVGTEVPTLGSTVTTGNSALQSVSNAKTGVRLSVKPVVHSSGLVDIDIDQSLSEASKTSTSSINSPSIFNRQIRTTVTLKDGGSILLGGLISNKRDRTDSGVPWVSKVPLVGNLFKSKSDGTERTELMVMIIPYVIDTPVEGEAITKTIQDAFQIAE